MADRMFRYYREDFGKIPVRVLHMDLVFDVFDDHTNVTSDLHAETLDSPLTGISLNAKNLEILAVSLPGSRLFIRVRYRKKPAGDPVWKPSCADDGFCYSYRDHLPTHEKYSGGALLRRDPAGCTTPADHPVPAVGVPAAGPVHR